MCEAVQLALDDFDTQISNRLGALTGKPVDLTRVTTWTGGRENDGTDGHIAYMEMRSDLIVAGGLYINDGEYMYPGET